MPAVKWTVHPIKKWSARAVEDQGKILIKANILQSLTINKMKSGAFRSYMKDQGKLRGQNKVPRLSNDRKIADQLSKYIDL